ncbi:effector binding domain-containing protein [Cohnella thailandensis]|uniref:AraC family transcriptional regulator n=1 Tax=Cohnella thailandensis TaxID=557557 RepID=A0A841SW68_9BACL|nr:AraC family transcriptional regulator [Cohnella thailandensis]MBP1972156.1 AraC family transcriptional regulator [Cohnella thailandensis]
MEWLDRMSRAISLMEKRMEGKTDIEELAREAYSSPFHFQRMFHMLTGFTVAEYIRRRKLTLAAQELASSSAKVLDIALKYGYESPESFSKAFRKAHGITPSEAREAGVSLKAFPRLSFHLSLKGVQDMDYRIVEKPAFRTLGIKITTSTEGGQNHRDITRFWQQAGGDGTIGKIAQLSPGKDLLGICGDMDLANERFDYWIAVENADRPADDEWQEFTVPATTWAVFPSVGPMPDTIQAVWRRIFEEWFPSTGYEHAAGPELEVYPEGDTSSSDYRCEVWIPIAKA